MSYENSDPWQKTLVKLSKVNGSLEIKTVKDKSDPMQKVFLIFIRIAVLGHRKSLVLENVKRFEKLNLSEGRITLEISDEGRMELVGIIRPKKIERLWVISLGLFKKMSTCLFSSDNIGGPRNERSTKRIRQYKNSSK